MCISIFYDISVYSISVEEHAQHLAEVLEILKTHQLYVNRSKYCLAPHQLEYLGHINSTEGVVAVDQVKIEAMLRWSTSKTL